MTAAIVLWLAASRPDADTIRRWARELTAGAQSTALTDFWSRALAWLAEQWLRVFGRRVASGFAASFDVLAIVALVFVVSVLLVALLRARRLSLVRGRLDAPPLTAQDHRPLDWEAAMRAAAASAADGEYRDAVRLRYRAMLLRLDAAGRLRYVPARTNGEAVAAALGAPFFAPFRQATLTFDRVWYGMRAADARMFRDLETLCAAAESTERAA